MARQALGKKREKDRSAVLELLPWGARWTLLHPAKGMQQKEADLDWERFNPLQVERKLRGLLDPKVPTVVVVHPHLSEGLRIKIDFEEATPEAVRFSFEGDDDDPDNYLVAYVSHKPSTSIYAVRIPKGIFRVLGKILQGNLKAAYPHFIPLMRIEHEFLKSKGIKEDHLSLWTIEYPATPKTDKQYLLISAQEYQISAVVLTNSEEKLEESLAQAVEEMPRLGERKIHYFHLLKTPNEKRLEELELYYGIKPVNLEELGYNIHTLWAMGTLLPDPPQAEELWVANLLPATELEGILPPAPPIRFLAGVGGGLAIGLAIWAYAHLQVSSLQREAYTLRAEVQALQERLGGGDIQQRVETLKGEIEKYKPLLQKERMTPKLTAILRALERGQAGAENIEYAPNGIRIQAVFRTEEDLLAVVKALRSLGQVKVGTYRGPSPVVVDLEVRP